MKRLSFLELEREMERENRIIKDKEALKAIEGGTQPSLEQQHFGLLSNNDAFSFKETTVVKGSLTKQTQTTQPSDQDLYVGHFNNVYENHSNSAFSTSFPTTTITTTTGFPVPPDTLGSLLHILESQTLPPNDGTRTQIGSGGCSFANMSLLNNYLGGNKTSQDYAQQWTDDHGGGSTWYETGIPNDSMNAFMGRNFEMSPALNTGGSFGAALQSHPERPFSASLSVEGAAHSIFITGANDDASIQYFDFATGKYGSTDFNNLYSGSVHQINSTKNPSE